MEPDGTIYGMVLNIHRWGDGDRRILLVHGICSSGATWQRIAEGIPDATAIAPDLRGHGASPRAERYRAADYAADLGTGWDLVIGHSLGGLIAVHAAAHDPAFAGRLILLDPVLELDDFDAVTAENVREAANPPTAEQIAAENPDWHPEDARLKALAASQADPHAVERTMHDNAPWAHAALLGAIGVPTLLFGGPMAKPGLGAGNPLVEHRRIPGTGHSLHRDRPELVLESI
jgi:pimeloyl-ACP methyl ester carboxylesterase